MRSESSWRSRAAALARHAAGAAGLGLAWIVLSGSPAAALGEITDIVGGAASSVVSTVSDTAAAPVQILPGGEDAAGPVTGTLGGVTSTTTSSLASVVEAAPAAVGPVLPEPLEPLVPVLEETTGAASGLVQDLGGTTAGVLELADTVVEDPLQVLPVPAAPPLPDIVTPPAPTQPAASSVPAPAADSASLIAAAPAQPVWEPTILVRLAASGLALAPEARALVPVLGSFTGPPDGWRFDLSLLAMPASPGAVGSGGMLGGPLLALAGGAFLLALMWRAGPRLFRSAPGLPASPAFDPGSTPD